MFGGAGASRVALCGGPLPLGGQCGSKEPTLRRPAKGSWGHLTLLGVSVLRGAFGRVGGAVVAPAGLCGSPADADPQAKGLPHASP
jgi:hypothetical protein